MAVFGIPEGVGLLDLLFQDAESWAVFGQATWNLTDRFHITAGLRWTSEKKDGGGDLFQPVPFVLPVVNPSYRVSVDEDEPTGTLSLQYDWTDNATGYITYTHGYKSGGINLAREAAGLAGQPAADPFDRELVDSFELGIKSNLMQNRLRLNAALFHNKYSDLQNSILSGVVFVVENGEGADVTGLEVEGTFAATDSLLINFGATLLDTSWDDGTIFDGVTDIGGRDLPWAPEFSAALGFDYTRAIGQGGLDFFFSANGLYKDGYYAGSGSADGTEEGSSTLVNGQVGISGNGDQWRVALWCRNCTDTHYSDVKFFNPLFGNPLSYIYRPREYGVTVRYRF
jgi:iron complex outermembrane receptor protein